MATPYSEEVIGRAALLRNEVRDRSGRLGSLGATNAYAIGQKMEPGMAEAAFRRIDRPDVDALVVAGRQLPDHGLDCRLGAPVRQAGDYTNQAALWAVLQTMKFDTLSPARVGCSNAAPGLDAFVVKI